MAIGSSGTGGRRRRIMADINITPLTDVFLVLLIIFMITTSAMMKPEDVQLPENAEEQQETQGVMVTLTPTHEIYVNDRPVAGDDPTIVSALRDALKNSKDKVVILAGRPAGRAGRGGARARARQGSRRIRLRAGVRVIRALVIAALLLGAGSAARAADTRGLEQRANAFYDRLARGDTAGARAAFPSLEQDLARSIDTLQDKMDEQREAIIDRDGDLEALYASPSWREDEVATLVLGYHLAWVRYQGAQLTDDATRKKKLLREAADGFEQYTAAEQIPEIYSESIYGRGLALMDLGQYGDAIGDLQTAAGLPRTAAKAKAALAEAKRRQSGGKPVAAPDPAEQLAQLRALLEAAAKNPDKGGEATEMARSLAAQGGDWPSRVQGVIRDLPPSSHGLALQGQLAIDAHHCDQLPALVKAGADLKDSGRARWRPELLYLTAACELNDGQQAEAARLFATLAAEFPNSPRAEEAAYYRCRALDTARHGDAAAEKDYEPALRDYLEHYGKSPRSSEIRYLLAELVRERGDCKAAIPLYEQVTSGDFATRARLGALECRVGALTPDAAAERTALLDELQRFVAGASKQTDERTLAKACLLGALVAVRQKPPDDAAALGFLDDYERRFPKESEWHDTARRVRLEARLRAGQYAQAEADVDALLAQVNDKATRKLVVRIGKDLMRPPCRRRGAIGGARAQDLECARRGRQRSAGPRHLSPSSSSRRATRPRPASCSRACWPYGPTRRRRSAVRRGPPPRSATGKRPWATGGRSSIRARRAARRGTKRGSPSSTLLVASGHTPEACDLARRASGQSKTTGGDVLAKQLLERARTVCR
jgi:biopolymer transport protein ExbD/tetratricopeptide (TPR) repeat protein